MIQINGIKEENKQYYRNYSKILEDITNSGILLIGKKLKTFEEKWASYCDSKYSVGLNSGLDALELSLKAMNLKKNDEIITTSLSAYATILSIYKVGCKPVIADIDPLTGLMDLESLKRCISKKTKVVLYVHLYGFMYNSKKLLEITRNNNLLLIEDCAQAHGAKENHIKAGCLGIIAAWSFYPTKNLGSLSDAGAITTSNLSYSKKISKLRDYGQVSKYEHKYIGYNSRLSEFSAGVLLYKMKFLNNNNDRRKKIGRIYHKNIKNKKIELLKEPPQKENHVYHQFVIKSKYRKSLINYLAKNKIQTLIHYPKTLYDQKASFFFDQDYQGLNKSKLFSKQCLSIPCHPYLTDNNIDKIINIINKF